MGGERQSREAEAYQEGESHFGSIVATHGRTGREPEGGYNRRLPNVEQLRKLAPLASLLVVVGRVAAVWKLGLIENVAERERLIHFLRQDGWRGPLLCIGVQYLQVIVFAIPGEITQIAAGYVFGAWWGFVYSVIGIFLGSATAFGVGRALGRPVAHKLLGEERLRKLEAAAQSKRGRTVLFLLFLLPGAPKDAMSYGSGVSGFRFGEFVVISSLGRAPALLFSTLFGAQLYERDYGSMAVTAAAAIVVALAFWRYQRRLGEVDEELRPG